MKKKNKYKVKKGKTEEEYIISGFGYKAKIRNRKKLWNLISITLHCSDYKTVGIV